MTAHRPAQILRLSAIIVSGAASLCLTVAAGAYIVNHMPRLDPPPTEFAGPAAAPNPGHHRPFPVEDSAPRDGGVELAMSWREPALSTERSAPAATRTPVTAQQSGVGARPDNSRLTGRVGIGGTYVGAQVAPPRSDSVSFTVDTNLVTVAAKYLGLTVDPAAVTALHTEFDARRGQLVFVLSDPGLGDHTLRVEGTGTEPVENSHSATESVADEGNAETPWSATEDLPTTVGV
ncbi:hypothetical protein [Nocardia alba]|uniref:Uncharacterized protein n=1 Tax=Nocardia alba TaxID=225051 RepID=A0A4R1G375_9NOCA|nr:hypothetical protein [Nocardia alba]TCK00740.1 hypothetical protein DFR71_1749 [Nocardia alba]